jgi:translation initiation factor IF-3
VLLPEALAVARSHGMDLVEVAPQATPPVCRVMDYGKFKFDAAQRAKESRRRSGGGSMKEMKYRPKIGPGDFDTKTRQVAKFLAEGHKVKLTIMFRGREVYHPDLGKKILDKVAEQVQGTGKVEIEPKLDGKNMVMVLAPDKRARQSHAAKTANRIGKEAGLEGASQNVLGSKVMSPSPPDSPSVTETMNESETSLYESSAVATDGSLQMVKQSLEQAQPKD